MAHWLFLLSPTKLKQSLGECHACEETCKLTSISIGSLRHDAQPERSAFCPRTRAVGSLRGFSAAGLRPTIFCAVSSTTEKKTLKKLRPWVSGLQHPEPFVDFVLPLLDAGFIQIIAIRKRRGNSQLAAHLSHCKFQIPGINIVKSAGPQVFLFPYQNVIGHMPSFLFTNLVIASLFQGCCGGRVAPNVLGGAYQDHQFQDIFRFPETRWSRYGGRTPPTRPPETG